MSTLVKGNQLPPRLQREVLAAYVHRWTHENAKQTYGGACPGCAQGAPKDMTQAQWHAYHVPLISDAQWLTDHAFYVTKQGTLDQRRTHAQPACLVA